MISLSIYMVLKAVAFSTVVGAVLGIVYTFIMSLSGFLIFTLLHAGKKQDSVILIQSIVKNVFDFSYTIITGTLFLLVLYAFTDGVFEIYSFIALVLSFIFCRYTSLRVFSFTKKT